MQIEGGCNLPFPTEAEAVLESSKFSSFFDPLYNHWQFSPGLTKVLMAFSLAVIEMKTLLRDVYSSYSTTPHKSMKAEDMVMSDQLISSRPQAQKCLLHFHPLGVNGQQAVV